MEGRGKIKVVFDKGIRGFGFVGGCLIVLNGIFITYDVAMRLHF